MNSPQAPRDIDIIGLRQRDLGKRGALAYARDNSRNLEPERVARAVLKNPVLLLDSIEQHWLPPHLSDSWRELGLRSAEIVEKTTKPYSPTVPSIGISMLSDQMVAGRLRPGHRPEVAAVIGQASVLFGLSLEELPRVPDRLADCTKNVEVMAGMLRDRYHISPMADY